MRYLSSIVLLACLILLSALMGRDVSDSQAQVPVVSNWKEVDLGNFSFHLPPEMKPINVRGTDSAVWKYVSDELELTIDFGLYSEKPWIYEEEPEYREQRIKVDGKKATLCFFRFSEPTKEIHRYAAAVYFSGIGSKETKLSFFAMCKTPKEQATAETIFRTIKFGASSKRR